MRRLKAEQRAERQRKTRFAPRGATRGAQRRHLETRKGYAGSAKKFIRVAVRHHE